MSFFVSSWIIIHFGKNPVNGGSPPSDNSKIISIVVRKGVLFHSCERDRVVVVLFRFKIMNTAVVVKM